MKRKRFTALKVTLTAMMLTAALTFGAGSAYAADLPQEGGTPSPEVTPELSEINGKRLMVNSTGLNPMELLLMMDIIK